jgi:hypothetical protein
MVLRLLQTFERTDADRMLEQAKAAQARAAKLHAEVGKAMGIVGPFETFEGVGRHEIISPLGTISKRDKWTQGKKK